MKIQGLDEAHLKHKNWSRYKLTCFVYPINTLEVAYRIAGKFGGLAVCLCNRQIKIRQNFLLAYIRMVIPYRTAKSKFANIFVHAG